VVLDFCQRLGIPFDASQIVIDNEGVSVDGLACSTFTAPGQARQLSSNDKLDIRLLTRQLGALQGDKDAPGPGTAQALSRTGSADMAWMEARAGQPDLALPPERPGALGNEADLLAAHARALAWLQQTLAMRCLLAHPCASDCRAGQLARCVAQPGRQSLPVPRLRRSSPGRILSLPTPPRP